MRIGSLFSGIGGLELGLERAGVGHTIWQCEADPYAQRVLARHWPDATIYPDVCAMGREEEVPHVEVICGGFPCQDISLAGRGAGLDGERSGLFFELLRVVRLVRPRYVVLENVSAILTRGLGAVLGALAEGGYDAWWDCIPAQAVGAPHRRDRWFCVAYASGERRGSDRTAGYDSNGEDARRQEGAGRSANGCKNVAYSASAGREQRRIHAIGGASLSDAAGGGWRGSHSTEELAYGKRDRPQRVHQARAPAGTANISDRAGDFRAFESGVGRIANGLPARVDRPIEPWEAGTPRTAPRGPHHRDRLRCLGNAVVPQVAEVIGRKLLAIKRGLT